MEVVIFGGGVGECVLVKIQEGYWIIVDSCLNSKTRKPVALEYLDKNGIDYRHSVKYIIATHWHDDHIKGLFQIAQVCENSKLVVSQALNKDEFYSLLATSEAHDRVLKEKTSGVQEFYKIFNFFKKNNTKERIAWAKQDFVIDKGCDFEFCSLSPSDKEITLTLEGVAEFLPQRNKSLRIISQTKPNNSSVVTFIKVKNLKILLGADLEEHTDIERGWHAVLANSKLLEKGIRVIKVPHHGSKNGYNENLWKNYLSKDCIALVTPFSRSRLPRNEDIDRIAALTKKSYCTAAPNPRFRPTENRTVRKTIRDVTKSYRILKESIGTVKVVYNFAHQSEEVELYGGAKELVDFKQHNQ